MSRTGMISACASVVERSAKAAAQARTKEKRRLHRRRPVNTSDPPDVSGRLYPAPALVASSRWKVHFVLRRVGPRLADRMEFSSNFGYLNGRPMEDRSEKLRSF